LSIDDLLKAAQSGDEAAREQMFQMLLTRFRILARGMVRDNEAAGDIAQDAAMDVLHAYRELDIHTSFAAWAHTVLRRRVFKHIERRRRRAETSIDTVGESIDNREIQLSSEFARRILKCLRKLIRFDLRYGRILNLAHQGYSFASICEKFGVNRNHAYVLLHRARLAMRKCLETGEVPQ